MDTVRIPGRRVEFDPPEVVAARIRKRRRRILSRVAFALVVTMLTTAGFMMTNYQPLVIIGDANCIGGESTRTITAGSECYFPFEADKRIGYDLTVLNNGPFPITILDMPLPSRENYPFDTIMIGFGSSHHGTFSPPNARPFRPFTLAPNEGAHLYVRGQFGSCPRGGTILSRRTTEFRLRLFGATHTDEIALPYGIAVQMPDNAICN